MADMLETAKEWDRQIRVNLTDDLAAVAQSDPAHESLKPLNDVLTKHNAVLKKQFAAFADFIPEAKRSLPKMTRKLVKALDSMQAAADENSVTKGKKAIRAFQEAQSDIAATYGLYLWTQFTLNTKGKAEKYETRFTLYVDGAQTCSAAVADAIENDLKPLKKAGMITRINNISSDPVKNPQAPAEFYGLADKKSPQVSHSQKLKQG